MKTLTRDDFFNNAPPLRNEQVEVPELGGAVYVRKITARERDEFEHRMQRMKRRKNAGGSRAQLVILAAVDEERRPLFTQDDAERLDGMPSSALEPIVNAYLRINSSNPAEFAQVEAGE